MALRCKLLALAAAAIFATICAYSETDQEERFKLQIAEDEDFLDDATVLMQTGTQMDGGKNTLRSAWRGFLLCIALLLPALVAYAGVPEAVGPVWSPSAFWEIGRAVRMGGKPRNSAPERFLSDAEVTNRNASSTQPGGIKEHMLSEEMFGKVIEIDDLGTPPVEAGIPALPRGFSLNRRVNKESEAIVKNAPLGESAIDAMLIEPDEAVMKNALPRGFSVKKAPRRKEDVLVESSIIDDMLAEPEEEAMTHALPRGFSAKKSGGQGGNVLVDQSVIDAMLAEPSEEAAMTHALPRGFATQKKKSGENGGDGLVDPSVLDAMLEDPVEEAMTHALPRGFSPKKKSGVSDDLLVSESVIDAMLAEPSSIEEMPALPRRFSMKKKAKSGDRASFT